MHISAIKQDTAHIESLVQQIGFLRLQLERPSMQDDRNLPLMRFLEESASYAESIVDPFGDDEIYTFEHELPQRALIEAESVSSSLAMLDEETSLPAARLHPSVEIPRSELRPHPIPGDFPQQNADSFVRGEVDEVEQQQVISSILPRSNYSRQLSRRAVGSTGSRASQPSSSQSSEATLVNSNLIPRYNVSTAIVSGTVLRAKIPPDEQADRAAASRRCRLTEGQQDELNKRLVGDLTGSLQPMSSYHYIGKDIPNPTAPDHLAAALLDAGANANSTDPDTGRCCLKIELLKASPRSSVIHLLLARGANLDRETARYLLIYTSLVCTDGDEIAEALADVALENGVPVNMQIEQNDLDEMLHVHYPNYTAVGTSIMAFSALHGALELLRSLSAHGGVFEQSDTRRLLFVATRLEEDRGMSLAHFALVNGASPDDQVEQSDVSAAEQLNRQPADVLTSPSDFQREQQQRSPSQYFERRHIGWTAVKYAVQHQYHTHYPEHLRNRLDINMDTDSSNAYHHVGLGFLRRCKVKECQWTFIRRFVQLLTDHGGSYDAEVLNFAVNTAAWDQLDWILEWKRNTNPTAEIDAHFVALTCVNLWLVKYYRRNSSFDPIEKAIDCVDILRSMIVLGAVLHDYHMVYLANCVTPGERLEVLQCYETERQRRLQVNSHSPGTFTDAQCCIISQLEKYLRDDQESRRQHEAKEAKEREYKRAQLEAIEREWQRRERAWQKAPWHVKAFGRGRWEQEREREYQHRQ